MAACTMVLAARGLLVVLRLFLALADKKKYVTRVDRCMYLCIVVESSVRGRPRLTSAQIFQTATATARM